MNKHNRVFMASAVFLLMATVVFAGGKRVGEMFLAVRLLLLEIEPSMLLL